MNGASQYGNKSSLSCNEWAIIDVATRFDQYTNQTVLGEVMLVVSIMGQLINVYYVVGI